MKRTNKLYEYRAVVLHLQTRLALDVGLNPLKLEYTKMGILLESINHAYKALQKLEADLDNMIEKETGNTVEQLWANAAENTRGDK